MARSLTISQEEKASTSPLLNLFLLLTFAWMIVGALASSQADAEPTTMIQESPIEDPSH